MIQKGLMILASLFLLTLPVYGADTVPLMNQETLRSLLDSPELVILDSRAQGDWSTSSKKIKGAIRASRSDYDDWKSIYPKDKTIVLYCS